MSSPKSILLAALAGLSVVAQATTVPLAANGQWQAFGVDSFSAVSGGTAWIDNVDTNASGYGSPLDFSFTVAAGFVGQLTVVDASLAGDMFKVFNHGSLLGATASVPIQQYASAPDVGYDYDAALLNNAFSRGVFTLGAGSYRISGALTQSLMLDGDPLNATAGAVKLSVSAVPEPSPQALVLAAMAVIGLLSRRRAAR